MTMASVAFFRTLRHLCFSVSRFRFSRTCQQSTQTSTRWFPPPFALEPKALFRFQTEPLFEEIVKLLADSDKIVVRVAGEFKVDGVTPYCSVSSVVPPESEKREDMSVSVNCQPGENLIGRGLGAEIVHEDASFRVASLIPEDCDHLARTQRSDHVLHDSLVPVSGDP